MLWLGCLHVAQHCRCFSRVPVNCKSSVRVDLEGQWLPLGCSRLTFIAITVRGASRTFYSVCSSLMRCERITLAIGNRTPTIDWYSVMAGEKFSLYGSPIAEE